MTVVPPGTNARRLFTVDECQRMAEAGILHPDERVELINGEILLMARRSDQHVGCMIRFPNWLGRPLKDDGLASIYNPLILSEHTALRPDLVVLRFRDDFYGRLPRAEDTLFLLEVEDDSLDFDRDVKLPLYAAAGIPEVWIANLRDTVIEVYRDPHTDRYQTSFTVGRDGSITPLLLSHLTVPVQALLG